MAYPPLSMPSLIGVVAVKLLLMTRFGLIISVGHTLLFAVGARAAAGWGQNSQTSQSGPRPCGFVPQALDSQRDRLALVPTGTIRCTLSGKLVRLLLLSQAVTRP